MSGKPQVDGGLESDGRKWVIAGIPLRAPLKRIYTNPVEKDKGIGKRSDDYDADEIENQSSTTPTAEDARIPNLLPCPQPPRKRKATLKGNFGGVREFFSPPDLESVFIRRAERAN